VTTAERLRVFGALVNTSPSGSFTLNLSPASGLHLITTIYEQASRRSPQSQRLRVSVTTPERLRVFGCFLIVQVAPSGLIQRLARRSFLPQNRLRAVRLRCQGLRVSVAPQGLRVCRALSVSLASPSGSFALSLSLSNVSSTSLLIASPSKNRLRAVRLRCQGLRVCKDFLSCPPSREQASRRSTSLPGTSCLCHYACKTSCLRLPLQRGAHPDLDLAPPSPRTGFTPVDFAARDFEYQQLPEDFVSVGNLYF
jgi:hypothetical protein